VNVLRFSVQGEVAEALKVRSLQDRARVAGVRHIRFTYVFTGLLRSERREFLCDVICSGQMAAFLIEQLGRAEAEAEHRGNTKLALACRLAAGNTLAILVSPRRLPTNAREPRAPQLAGAR
jgi:hypothetical protein